MSYKEPTLRARLNNSASGQVSKERYGKENYYNNVIGITRVHVEQGLVYAQIGWGVDGNDLPVSPDITEYVVMYEITTKVPYRTAGIYKLRDDQKKVVAAARVNDEKYSSTPEASEVYVSGENRKDVIKLFGLIHDGKIRPDIEHEEFKQVESNLNELRRLRRQLPALERQVKTRDETIASMREQLQTQNVSVELTEAQAATATN